jgi:hypothetical protein
LERAKREARNLKTRVAKLKVLVNDYDAVPKANLFGQLEVLRSDFNVVHERLLEIGAGSSLSKSAALTKDVEAVERYLSDMDGE